MSSLAASSKTKHPRLAFGSKEGLLVLFPLLSLCSRLLTLIAGIELRREEVAVAEVPLLKLVPRLDVKLVSVAATPPGVDTALLSLLPIVTLESNDL